ncbi:hypothetical protein B9G55_11115 [Saccharibacillus sp. O16]|nr:hypothetical protein B9G55_11115 [Saccharibacillus sp. O16]
MPHDKEQEAESQLHQPKDAQKEDVQNENAHIRTLFFHEDDYAMLELIPTNRQDQMAVELEQIRTFADEHRTEGGYTDLYVHQSDPKELAGLRIPLAKVERAIASFAAPYDQVITGYGSSYRVECQNIRAFGPNEETVLLCEHEQGMIHKAWMLLNIEDREQYEWTLKLLHTLAGIAPLVLADLMWGVQVELCNEEAVRGYLDGYLNEDEEA